MRLRNIVANMCMKGTENKSDIESVHCGYGCPQWYGFKETDCCGQCQPCYDRNNRIVFTKSEMDGFYTDSFRRIRMELRGERA